jgi:hypothetical protein
MLKEDPDLTARIETDVKMKLGLMRADAAQA